jgi:hypothetical protein
MSFYILQKHCLNQSSIPSQAPSIHPFGTQKWRQWRPRLASSCVQHAVTIKCKRLQVRPSFGRTCNCITFAPRSVQVDPVGRSLLWGTEAQPIAMRELRPPPLHHCNWPTSTKHCAIRALTAGLCLVRTRSYNTGDRGAWGRQPHCRHFFYSRQNMHGN